MGQRSCHKTSVNNYQSRLCNIQEERRAPLDCGGGLKTRLQNVMVLEIVKKFPYILCGGKWKFCSHKDRPLLGIGVGVGGWVDGGGKWFSLHLHVLCPSNKL